MNPLEFISWYHVLVLHVAALLRLLVAFSFVNDKLQQEKRNFVWQVYFADKWDNWAVHYVSMWALLLILPSIVHMGGAWIAELREIKDNVHANMIATAAVGFLGYDAVKKIMDKFKSK